ncbi:poly-gamma-glutamate synthesis protein (capsule biosynthesis protein) [Marinobacter sp. es.042]|uniref:CapA family protein n=1 Tax=Marinobacter sp. es.042 TaxID=1761794 RepID=UPI000B507C24|nr:CapA family protein [Marinobacter sp. es.042]SNB55490.1 poly-gamma-glutamate synthesis protein (capsule biosynthesis protein) [Marinobacter sp. es.042]
MRLLFVGDVNLGEYYLTFGHGPKTTLETVDIFEDLRQVLYDADVVAGNLEASLTNSQLDPNDPERMVLRGDPKQAEYLRNSGFNVFQVANNHTVQHGREGFEETVEVLRQSEILPIGLAGQDLQIIRIQEKTIGFFAASDVPDNTDKDQKSYQRLDRDFIERIKGSIKKVDYLFVMLHWGLEESTHPMSYQRALIDELVEAGVTGIIGSHPHLFYEVWRQGNSIVAPSLGNFVFDLCWDSRLLKTGILEVVIDDANLEAKIWPIEITRYGAVPKLTGVAQEVADSVMLYDLGTKMDYQAIRKIGYFFRNIHKGKIKLKIKFIFRKLINRFTTVPKH